MIIRLLFILRRRWPILVVVPALSATAAIVFSPRGAAVTAQGYISTVTIAADDQAASPIEINQAMLDLSQGYIGEQVAEGLGDDVDVRDVDSHLTSTFNDKTFVLTMTVNGKTPEESARYAEAIGTTFVEAGNAATSSGAEQAVADATRARDEAAAALQEFIAVNREALSQPNPPPIVSLELQDLQSQADSAESQLRQVEAENPPTVVYRLVSTSDPAKGTTDKLQIPASRSLRLSLGLIFGLAGAATLIALVEKLNPRIDDPTHATDIVGAPVLCQVPILSRSKRSVLYRADLEAFKGPFAEAFRAARSHLDFRVAAEGWEKPPRLLVASAMPGEGKSTAAAFLALAYAEIDRAPVVVGADLRRPTLHRLFGVTREPGLSTRAIDGAAAVPLGEIVQVDDKTGVAVIPPGPGVDRVTGLTGDLIAISTAGQTANRPVLIDTAPVLVANDAMDFMAATDWVVVVVRAGRSTERAVRQMVQSLTMNDVKVVGVLMVGSLESTDAKHYYYSYYSDGDATLPYRVRSTDKGDDVPPPAVGDLAAPASEELPTT